MSARSRYADPDGPKRYIDPRTPGDRIMLRHGGVATQRDIEDAIGRLQRFPNQLPHLCRRIGYHAPTTGNQTISATSYAAVTGTAFALSLGGPKGLTWSVDIGWTCLFLAFGAADDQVSIRPAVSWDGGVTWQAPSIDASTTQMIVQAYYDTDFFRAKSSSDGQTLRCHAVFGVRSEEDVRVRLEAKIWTAGDTATIELGTDEVTPHCVGTAYAYEGQG
jgi:hypothetical protein